MSELFKIVFIGIIQGVTEWLPVSSTGHMILFGSFCELEVTEVFWELFSVLIQLGSILAVVVLYFDRLNPFSRKKDRFERKRTFELWKCVVIGSIPLALVGLAVDKPLTAIFYGEGGELNVSHIGALVIAAALVVYGVIFVATERKKTFKIRIYETDGIDARCAFCIGIFQSFAVIPGTSRSGSTIFGGKLLGLSGACASEFSFFLAIPAMLGVGGFKFIKLLLIEKNVFSSQEWLMLAVGFVTAFAVSLGVISFLMDFVKKHTFIPFGIYRIILGTAVLIWTFVK